MTKNYCSYGVATLPKSITISTIVNQISIDINGKGGGQPFFAVASGDKIGGITQVLKHFKQIITNL